MPLVEIDEAGGGTTLATVCAELGADIIEVVEAPAGLDATIASVRIHDPTGLAPQLSQPGDLIMAIGVPVETEALRPLLAEAGAGGAAAVVIRGGPDSIPPGLRRTARAAGVALAVTKTELTWERLYDLIQATIVFNPDPGMTGGVDPAAGELFALADATAELAGGPVTIEDNHSRVIAFSRGGQDVDPVRAATILHRGVPRQLLDELRRVEFIKRLHRSELPLTISLEGLEPRRVIAIRGGGKVLGSIWVAGDPDRLSSGADDALQGAARIAALQLMRRDVTADVERRLRDGRLQALLRGERAGAGVLADLELAGRPGLVVVAIEVGRPAADDAVALRDRLSGLLRVHLSANRRVAAVTVMLSRIYTVIGCEDAADRDVLHQTLLDGLRRAENVLHEPFRGGLGAWYPLLEGTTTAIEADLAEARRSADRALELGGEPGRIIPFEKVHARALLADVVGFVADRQAEPSPELKQLIELDRTGGSEYVRTLRVFLDSLADVKATARELDVHENTVRYRLRRVSELTGLDLDDGEARFAFELQLRVFTGDSAPAGES